LIIIAEKGGMSDDAIVKRLKVIVKDHGGQLALAQAIGVDQGFISKVINQKQEMSYYLIRKLCFQLKYSPEWLIIGTGEKKLNKPDSAKLITEIQMLRTEVDILHARMRVFELQLKELEEAKAIQQRKAAG
jgi:transcriptional regulator with XRE-family HTH domain